MFGVLYGPMPIAGLLATGMTGKGHQVSGIVIAVFVAVVVFSGLFLGRQLAWNLDERGRTGALVTTLLVGLSLWATAVLFAFPLQ